MQKIEVGRTGGERPETHRERVQVRWNKKKCWETTNPVKNWKGPGGASPHRGEWPRFVGHKKARKGKEKTENKYGKRRRPKVLKTRDGL